MRDIWPKVPIVGLTLNYRDPERTRRCVESLLDEGVDCVWIWDNSEDGGYSVGMLTKIFAAESRVILRESDSNLGFASAVNRSLSEIVREYPKAYVLIINNDAQVLPGAISTLGRALMDQPRAKIICPAFLQNGLVIRSRYYHRWMGLITNFRIPGSFVYPSGCALLVALERIRLPLFDEQFFMYGEDVMLGWVLQRPGDIVFNHGALINHEGSATSKVGSLFYETKIVEGHWILAHKLARNSLELLFAYTGRCAFLLLRALVRSVRYTNKIPIKAFFLALNTVFFKDPPRGSWQH